MFATNKSRLSKSFRVVRCKQNNGFHTWLSDVGARDATPGVVLLDTFRWIKFRNRF